jgi:hypothetical protein
VGTKSLQLANRVQGPSRATGRAVDLGSLPLFASRAVFAHGYVSGQVMADALLRIGEYVADHGLRGEGTYQAARDLLLRERPRIGVPIAN